MTKSAILNDLKIPHVLGFTLGVIGTAVITRFMNTVSEDIIIPIITEDVNRSIGKDKTIIISGTSVKVNKVIAMFLQMLVVFSIVYILVKFGIKPQTKLL